jgi:hypothetical protein
MELIGAGHVSTVTKKRYHSQSTNVKRIGEFPLWRFETFHSNPTAQYRFRMLGGDGIVSWGTLRLEYTCYTTFVG